MVAGGAGTTSLGAGPAVGGGAGGGAEGGAEAGSEAGSVAGAGAATVLAPTRSTPESSGRVIGSMVSWTWTTPSEPSRAHTACRGRPVRTVAAIWVWTAARNGRWTNIVNDLPEAWAGLEPMMSPARLLTRRTVPSRSSRNSGTGASANTARSSRRSARVCSDGASALRAAWACSVISASMAPSSSAKAASRIGWSWAPGSPADCCSASRRAASSASSDSSGSVPPTGLPDGGMGGPSGLFVGVGGADVGQGGILALADRQVTDAHDADDTAVVQHRQPPYRVVLHDLGGVDGLVVARHRDQVRADHPAHRRVRGRRLGDGPDHEVTVGDQPAQLVPVHHQHRADRVVPHGLGRVGDGLILLQHNRLGGHHVAHLGHYVLLL